jgi:hypothetical protein
MLGKCSTTELHPRSSRFCFWDRVLLCSSGGLQTHCTTYVSSWFSCPNLPSAGITGEHVSSLLYIYNFPAWNVLPTPSTFPSKSQLNSPSGHSHSG